MVITGAFVILGVALGVVLGVAALVKWVANGIRAAWPLLAVAGAVFAVAYGIGAVGDALVKIGPESLGTADNTPALLKLFWPIVLTVAIGSWIARRRRIRKHGDADAERLKKRGIYEKRPDSAGAEDGDGEQHR